LTVTSDPLPWLAFLPAGSAADVSPTQLAARSYIRDLTLAGDQLVWSSGQAVQRMARAGGPVFSVVGADHFALAGDRLAYVANRRLVLRSLATGSEAGIAADVETVRAMAVDASFVYWITGDELWAADPATLTSRQIATVATGYLPVDQALAQDDLFLYVLQKTPRDTNIVRIRKPASTTSFPAPLTCRAPMSTCSDDPFVTGPCFDLSNDPYNCGVCGTMCATGEVCTNGACSCGTAALVCGGTCVDPTTDANNCGACGRTCGTGACVGGDCAPVMVTSEFMTTPVDDAGGVYFAQGHDVKRYDKQTSQVTLLRTLMYARDLAIDATRVYIIETAGTIGSTNPGTIHALSKDGQTLQPLFAGRPDPRDLAVLGSKVVWIEDASDASETPATMAAGAITGTGSPELVNVLGLYTGAADDRSVGFAVAGTSAYWLLGDPTASTMRSAIVRVDFSTSPPTVSLVTEMTSGYPRAIAVVGTQLYVTLSSFTDPVMLSVPITGGVATLVTKTGEDVQILAPTADGGLMWLEGERSPASIRLLAAGALSPRTVALVYESPTGILPDGGRFFIATEHGLMLVR
ncbi:MAG: hypothetical protein ABI175_25720, partial [Polyangiales bacterium]